MLLGLVSGAPLAAQEPPDTIQEVPPDSLAVLDSLAAQEDTVSADTIFYNLPSFESRVPEGFATGVWEWNRDDIMASGAHTLAELVAEVPGVIGLRGGDYGTPLAISAFGLGSGGVRIVRDGFEVYPVDGGVADLQRVGLGGIARVRLDRSMGVVRIEMWSHAYDDGRPFSIIEAGTGDLDTNMFRGVYADPTALFGSLAGALERIDTRGIGADEGGNRTGSWVRYQLHMRERAGLSVDYRSMSVQTKATDYVPTSSRSDLVLRATARVTDGIFVEAYTGRSTLDVETEDPAYDDVGGKRSQHGARLGLEAGALWAIGGLRLFRGDRLPSRVLDVSGGATLAGWGGVAGSLAQASWKDASTESFAVRAWLGSFAGATAFAAYEAGSYGGRDGPLRDLPPPPPLLAGPDEPPGDALITDRTTFRAGATLSLFGATVSGAALYAEADEVHALGTELDRGSPSVPGVHRKGLEGWGRLPMPMTGLALEASLQRWDEGGPYLPARVYRASFEFHRVYKETENLELWWSLGVRGHDPMAVFGGAGGLQAVPFYQSWYGRIQVRVVTVRLFLGWENFTLRRNLQDFPGRTLPFARSFFGLRWDMWN